MQYRKSMQRKGVCVWRPSHRRLLNKPLHCARSIDHTNNCRVAATTRGRRRRLQQRAASAPSSSTAATTVALTMTTAAAKTSPLLLTDGSIGRQLAQDALEARRWVGGWVSQRVFVSCVGRGCRASCAVSASCPGLWCVWHTSLVTISVLSARFGLADIQACRVCVLSLIHI